jgi:hypothetical protein
MVTVLSLSVLLYTVNGIPFLFYKIIKLRLKKAEKWVTGEVVFFPLSA